MRDHEVFRARLAIALALGLGGCTNHEAKPEPEPQDAEQADRADEAGKSGTDETKTNAETKSEPTSDTKGDGMTSLVEKIRAEEAAKAVEAAKAADPATHCESPELTLTVEQADLRRLYDEDVLGCARSVSPGSMGRRIRNLRLDESATQGLRDAKNEEYCCYEKVRIRPPVRGRLLVDADRIVLPGFTLGAKQPSPEEIDPALGRRVAAGWLHDARLEWASVGAFERAALELRALGAPESLCAQHLRAALEERHHAALCVRWAQHFSGRSVRLQPLPPLAPRLGDELSCLRQTFTEGCMAETAAALVAHRSARRARADIAPTLARITDDEASHAALAWTTVGWLLARCTAVQRRRWLAWARRQRPAAVARGADPHARYGRCSSATERAIAADAWRHCIEPLLDEIERLPLDTMQSGTDESDPSWLARRAPSAS